MDGRQGGMHVIGGGQRGRAGAPEAVGIICDIAYNCQPGEHAVRDASLVVLALAGDRGLRIL